MERNKKIIGYLFILLVVILILYAKASFYFLNINHSESVATIDSIYYVGGRSANHYNARYFFKVRGKEYFDNVPIGDEKFSLSVLNQKLLGKHLPLIYNRTWAINNRLLIKKTDYERFSIVMPDSLKWIDNFLSR